MHLNLALQATPNPFFAGMWRSPDDDTSLGYRSLAFWQRVATTAERGCFDAVIFEPTAGIPRLDPMMLMSALAAVTEYIGLVTTPDLGALPPAAVAEQLSSLDHISDGRMGWRIDDVEASALTAAVALWEESWVDDAMVFDTKANAMVEPSRVREIPGVGTHPVEPTRQRTPALFARADAMNGPAQAEVLLVDPVPVGDAAAAVEEILDAVDAADRSFDEVKLVMSARTIVARDDAHLAQLKRQVDRFAGDGTSASLALVGTAGQVADAMQHYLDAGFDGFSLMTTPLPAGLDLIIGFLIPELQERQMFRRAYEASSLREHYFGYGQNRLSADHPARARA